MTHNALTLLVCALAVFRLTHLLVDDAIMAPVRDAVSRNARGRVFITCPWCVSIWAGAGVVALQALLPTPWWYVACALSFSAITGLIAERS